MPGTLELCRPSSHTIAGPFVANLYAQYYMGKDRERNYASRILIGAMKRISLTERMDSEFYNGLKSDTIENRIKWFRDSLNKLVTRVAEENIRRVIFPYRIGCGLAAGNWDIDYLPAIQEFCTEVGKLGVDTVIVRRGLGKYLQRPKDRDTIDITL